MATSEGERAMSKQLVIKGQNNRQIETRSNLHLWHGNPLLLKVSGSYGGGWVEEYGRSGVWNRGTRNFNLYVHVQVTTEAKESAYILQALFFFVFFPYQCAVPPISLLPTVTQQRGKWGVAAGGSLAGGLHWQVKVGLCIGKVQQHVYYKH